MAKLNSNGHFLAEIVDETMPMQPLDALTFDGLMAKGWRLLGNKLVRHNYSSHHGQLCRTIPLRIRLSDFERSKSQQQVWRRHAHLNVSYEPIQLTEHVSQLFDRHAQRFAQRRPRLPALLGENAHLEPVPGMMFAVSNGLSEPIAYSFIHLGHAAVSATYCIYDPSLPSLSLGTYTMLLELEQARRLDKTYYYHGYVLDVPSPYDYKYRWHGVQAMDWRTGEWGDLRF